MYPQDLPDDNFLTMLQPLNLILSHTTNMNHPAAVPSLKIWVYLKGAIRDNILLDLFVVHLDDTEVFGVTSEARLKVNETD